MPASKMRRLPVLFRAKPAVKRVLRFASAVVALGTLSGCQGIVSSPILSQIRVIVASADSGGLDIYENTALVVPNLGFGTITSYVPTNPGTYTFSAKSAGTAQVLTSTKATLAASGQYTILIGDSAASLQQIIVKDQSQAAPTGQIALRFINENTVLGGLDVYLVPSGQTLLTVSPVYTNLTLSVNTGYLNVPTGTYTLVMVPTGTVPASTTIATYAGAQVTYSSGSATTFVLINQQLVTTPGLKVLTATDYVTPGN